MTENVRHAIDEGKFEETLAFFNALGDKTRLRIVSLLLDGERNVGDLAAALALTEPTVSHHLAKLRPTGLVRLRFDGNQRFYSVNTQTLQGMGQQITALAAFRFDYEVTTVDHSWLDALDLDDFARKTLRACTDEQQRLLHIPRKHAKLVVVLEWLATFFERDQLYTEREINDILKQRYHDYVSLRRDLVDMQYLRRDRSGSKYVLEGSFVN